MLHDRFFVLIFATQNRRTMEISDKEAMGIIKEFADKIANSKPIDREIQKIINENFWDFLK